MSDIPPIVLPHGNYKDLTAYKKSDVVYEGTVCFCRRFLSHGNRTIDQMIQAARSCKQNLVEGSMASGTSKETEMKLVNVARASIEELLEDYKDWLRTHGADIWPLDDPRTAAARKLGLSNVYDDKLRAIFETRPPEVLCNLQICFIHQTKYLIDHLIKQLEEDFDRHGGIRERMHAARTAARGADWEKVLFSRLDSAANAADLAARIAEIRDAIARIERSVRQRKGWR